MEEVLKLEHGGGGRLTRELLDDIIIPSYYLNRLPGGIGLPEMDDGASIPFDGKKLVITTDATTVKPIFFPGGDLGKLAICGAVNDLSMMGAKPLAFTSTLVVEEGFSIGTLRTLLESMDGVMRAVRAPLIAGDTKVMDRGSLDKIVASTTGIGIVESVISDSGLQPGDKIIVTGTIGNHQLALLSKREGLEFEAPIESDVAPLWEMVEKALEVGGVTSMKDPTRGGLAGALNEISRKARVDIHVREEEIPIRGVVNQASEMLGLDPLELANEGVAVMGVKAVKAKETLKSIKKTEHGSDAAIVGEAREGSGRVILETPIGGLRIVREPYGSPMPRIC